MQREKMAVDAVASVVLQKLLLVDESFASNKIIGRRLKHLKTALETTSWRTLLEAADEETSAVEIKKWTKEYLHHIYSVEDSVESFVLSFTRQRKKLGFLMNHALFLKKFTALKMLDNKLHGIQTKVRKLNSQTTSLDGSSCRNRSLRRAESDENNDEQDDDDDDDDREAEEMQHTSLSSIVEESEALSLSIKGTKSKNHSWKQFSRSNASVIRERLELSKFMYSYSYNEEELPIVGYQRKVTEIQHRLVTSDNRVIPIVGEMGSGKTMLARAVYGYRSINYMFELSAWVSIFMESKITEILLALLKEVGKSELENGSSEASLKQTLMQELTGRKYFIVLDGIQTWDQWEELKDAFPDEETGSKIILTTCEKDDRQLQPYYLEKLNPEESWTLFKTKVGSLVDPEASLKSRIIRVCRGLPLNIVLLGSLLSMKDREKWSETLDNHKRWQAFDIMQLSYNDLDDHLKLCLIYMTLFPKELDIPVRRLLRLWLAEGFVELPQEKAKFQEDVVEEYFEKLVKRSLILVSKQRSDGSARRCRLQGALRGLLLEQAREICLFHIHGSNARDYTRRLVEYASVENSPLEFSQIQKVRSYISFNLQTKDIPANHVGSLVSKMLGKGVGLLRVLDLEGVNKPSLPENLGDLFHLRYLGLRWTHLDKLPKSVGELPYLQTLDLKHTRIDKIPTSIWKLKNLQHLNLDEVYLDKDTPLHFQRSFPELLTLWGLSVSQESPIKNGLSKLEHLRELGISFRFIKRDDNISQDGCQSIEALVEWISKLTDLRSLRLRSIDSGCHSDLSLKSFSNLVKLSHMKLLGKLQQLPTIEQFPPHIKVLTLSLSYLSQDPMKILGQLPDLTVLRLLGDSYIGETLVCSSGTFKNLEVLKLWKLVDLKKWQVEDGTMKKLKQVNIRNCLKLESFPISLLQQKTFQNLILNNMPPAFKDSIDNKYQFKVSTKDLKDL